MPQQDKISLSMPELFTALSYALDITEGQPRGHSVRCCWIGIHIGKELRLPEEELQELYYMLLLKDCGCSSNAARLFQLYGSDDLKTKKSFKYVDSHKLPQVIKFILDNTTLSQGRLDQLKRILNFVQNGNKLATELIQTRCERGANITRRLGFSIAVADGVRHLDEHYNGGGKPDGLKGKQIPLYSAIALLAQVADVFYQVGGPAAAKREVISRGGTWFDPKLVNVFTDVAVDDNFWEPLKNNCANDIFSLLRPQSQFIIVTETYLDTVAGAFADVIDAKSPFTFGHSTRVAKYSDLLAAKMGIPAERRRWFYRGALLHDVGKLGVSNSILDKPGKLTDEEFAQVKLHPKYTEEILSKISIFRELALVAGAHHERLDGKGYHKGLSGDQIGLETRILTLADIFDALTANRPYRPAMPVDKAMAILAEMRGTAIDGNCFDAFRTVLDKTIITGAASAV